MNETCEKRTIKIKRNIKKPLIISDIAPSKDVTGSSVDTTEAEHRAISMDDLGFPLQASFAEGNSPEEDLRVIMSNAYSNQSKTKKKKTKMSTHDKSKLWSVFDVDKQTIDECEKKENITMECIYSTPKELETCYLCNSHLVIMENGFPTCTNVSCGVMYKDILDYSPEWRFYGAEDKNANDPTRCGNPINPLLVESSFGCKVLCNNKSSYEMKKIRKWTEWQSMPHKEKSLYDEFQFITIMAQNSGIPRIFIDYAMTVHKDISEQKMFRGMNRDGIKAASIYISCRLNGCPRTAHEIAEIFRLDKTSATNGCSMAVNILQNIERNIEPAQKTELCATLPSSFIDRYCSRLNFNKELTMLSKFVANKIEQNNIIADNIPHAIAAGIIYFIAQNCQINITKQEVKSICGVSEVTINKCYKKLDAIRENLLPKSILAKYS
jgi:transcription initiation factor TFIIB